MDPAALGKPADAAVPGNLLATPLSASQNIAARPEPSSPTIVVREVRLGAVPVEIGLKSLAGIDRFEIRLDPVELGRIDVRLDFSGDGGVKAHLLVDRAETLALLQRDGRALDRALEQAGLTPSDEGVGFSLRDASSQSGQPGGNGRSARGEANAGPGGPAQAGPAEADPASGPSPRPLRRGLASLDIRI